jgi:DNA-binding PadR family transcriptional regulator
MTAIDQESWLPISDRVILLRQHGSSLLLYENGVEIYRTLSSFIESGLKNGELCVFAYDNTDGKRHPERVLKAHVEAGDLQHFPLEKGGFLQEIKELSSKIEELCEHVRPDESRLKDEAVRVAIDFGSLPTPSNFSSIIDCVMGMLKKKDGKIPLRVVTTFNVDFLPDDAIGRLLELHENVMTSMHDEHRMFLINYRSPGLPSPSPAGTVSKKDLERFVKKHLEIIVLSLMLRSPMCGYDLIRAIFHRYHNFLSQGTVYPVLYDLQRRELLRVDEGKNPRSKVYALTEHGVEEAKTRISQFISAQEYVLESIRKF